VELGLLDTDNSPTKKLIEQLGEQDRYWQFCFGKRSEDELFDLSADPDCVKNLASEPVQRERLTTLREQLLTELRSQRDPRVLGRGDIFDNYPTSKKRETAPKK
jgi:hypothetical protein